MSQIMRENRVFDDQSVSVRTKGCVLKLTLRIIIVNTSKSNFSFPRKESPIYKT